MATKTYVLLESMDADAPVYRQTAEGGRIQVKKIPFHRPTLRQEFQDENGVSRVIRYKSASKYIDQDKQMTEEKIDANAPFTTSERRDCEFRFGVLTTNKLRAQDYLEAHPEFQGFKGTCDSVREPKYKLLDEVGDAKIENAKTRKRVKAANKIYDLDLAGAKEMIIKLNGFSIDTPDDLDLCQQMLIKFIDDHEEEGLDAVLSEETTNDEKNTVLIGLLVEKELLNFDLGKGKVSKKDAAGKWVAVKDISADTMDEQKRLFSQYLLTKKGAALLEDLNKALSDSEIKK